MEFRGREASTNIDRVVKKVAIAVDSTVTIATPVDTGRARSNWIASLGTPTDEVLDDAYVPGGFGPLRTNVPRTLGADTGAINAAIAIGRARALINSRRPGTDIWLSNNLDYIGDLNRGSSAQAPAMFVQQAAAEAARVVAGARIFRVN